MNLDPVTTRWCEALFRLAQQRKCLEEVQRDVARLGRELATAAGRRILDPRLPQPQRRAQLGTLLASLSPLVRQTVELAFDKRREELLAHLSEAFRQRLLEEQGMLEGLVESPRPMSEGDIAELAVALGSKLGKHLVLKNKVAPELIGGARVYIGARMLDASVQGRLDGLRRALLEAPLPTAAAH